MRIEEDKIYADEGKVIHRIGSDVYGSAIWLIKGEDETDFEELDHYPTPEEVEAYNKAEQYNDAINSLIRKRYSVSQELAILRQRDTKPEEYAEYNAYAELCKSKVKQAI